MVELEQILTFVLDLVAIYSVYLIVTLSLNLEFGYAGVPNFGKVLGVAGGAYIVGYLPGRLAAAMLMGGEDPLKWFTDDLMFVENSWRVVEEVNKRLSEDVGLSLGVFLLTLVVAGLAGAALGYLASYPAIRLRSDYLAMTLLAMGEGIRIIGENYRPLVGGQLPVAVPDPFSWSPDRFLTTTVVILVIAVLILIYLETLIRSPLGRTLRAMRDNENAAAALGKDLVGLRMRVLVVGSAVAAIGGALNAYYSVSVQASYYERVNWTFWPWAMVVIGGAANNIGVAAGVLAIITVRRLIDVWKWALQPFLPFDPVRLSPLLTGIAIILMLMFRPQGVIPEKPTRTIKVDRVLERVRVRRSSDRPG